MVSRAGNDLRELIVSPGNGEELRCHQLAVQGKEKDRAGEWTPGEGKGGVAPLKSQYPSESRLSPRVQTGTDGEGPWALQECLAV